VADQVINPGLWADNGGLIGLVVFALFYVLYSFSKHLNSLQDKHREDLSKLMDLHAKERDKWSEIVDVRQRSTNETIKSISDETNQSMRLMAEAINKMACRYRATDHHIDNDASYSQRSINSDRL
jgi:predicted Holliday junction resolvase-like endonuclease